MGVVLDSCEEESMRQDRRNTAACSRVRLGRMRRMVEGGERGEGGGFLALSARGNETHTKETTCTNGNSDYCGRGSPKQDHANSNHFHTLLPEDKVLCDSHRRIMPRDKETSCVPLCA
eukprot:966094-Rhodomonas_salina.4